MDHGEIIQELRSLEGRVTRLEREQAAQGQQLSVLIEQVTTSRGVLGEIARDLKGATRQLNDHVIAEERDRKKLLIGVISAALSSLSLLMIDLFLRGYT